MGLKLVKSFLTAKGKPRLIEAHMLTISSKPAKCSLLFNLLTISLNN